MSVRKREWTTPKGIKKTAWLVDYRDAQGVRRAKQFPLKKKADDFLTTAGWEVQQGTHTADSKSITVKDAADKWLARGRRENLEGSTLDAYDQHIRLHINPFLGAKKLNQLTQPMIEEYRDQLLDTGRSRAMAIRVLRSLTSIVKEAKRLGHVAKNVCEDVTVRRAAREKEKVVPPTKEQIRALIKAADAMDNTRPMAKPMLMVLIYAGLRASELRGLVWRNVDLVKGTIMIDQRADRKNVIGAPKSAAGRRSMPLPVSAIAELKKWKLRCPKSDLDLVFPSEAGTPIFWPNLVLGFQEPLQIAAGVTAPKMKDGKPVLDDKGRAVLEGLYGLHSFRHAAASLWIEQRVPAKRVQTWMGHSSIQVTFDTYGHLFAALDDDSAVMAAMEAGVMGTEAA